MYYAYICKIDSIRPHGNAHSLKIATVLGSNVVVGLDCAQGDIVCYFPEGGQLSKEFTDANKLTRDLGGYFDSNRKIRIQKFRGEISDGFVCKLEMLENFAPGTTQNLRVGDRISQIEGKPLCNKFVTEATLKRASQNYNKSKPTRGSTLYFPKHKDTDNIKYVINNLKKDDILIITNKHEGSSHRLGYVLDDIVLPKWKRIINRFYKVFPTKKYRLMSGSRNVILENMDENSYNVNLRAQITKYFEGKLNKGELLFMEVVGYDGEKPIMSAHNTTKLKDREFTQKYGDKMVYSYGCSPGNYELYLYRVAYVTEEGYVHDMTWDAVESRALELGIKSPHAYERIVYDGDPVALMDKLNDYADREDPCGLHWSEGIVIRRESSHFKAYKLKNSRYLMMAGILKDDQNYVDAEEAS